MPLKNILLTQSLFFQQTLLEPVAVIVDQSLNILVFEDTLSRAKMFLVYTFIVMRIEVLYDEANGYVMVAMVNFLRIYKVNLQAPFSYMDCFVAQLRELQVTPVASKLIYCFLGENCFHKMVTVADNNDRQYFCNDDSHVSLQCHWHLKRVSIH